MEDLRVWVRDAIRYIFYEDNVELFSNYITVLVTISLNYINAFKLY